MPQVEARAKELTISPSWRTGICRMVMKVRNEASVPTVISPAITLLPPTQSTRPMAAKNEKVMALVLITRIVDALVRELERAPRRRVEFRQLVRLGGEGAHDADAAEVLLHDAGQDREPLLQHRARWRAAAAASTDERQATKGTKLSASRPSTQVGGEQHIGADADQDRQQDHAHEPGGEEHPHALEIEHADA